jgi:hypothetical protein
VGGLLRPLPGAAVLHCVTVPRAKSHDKACILFGRWHPSPPLPLSHRNSNLQMPHLPGVDRLLWRRGGGGLLNHHHRGVYGASL